MLDILQENENSWFERFRAKTALILVFLTPIWVFQPNMSGQTRSQRRCLAPVFFDLFSFCTRLGDHFFPFDALNFDLGGHLFRCTGLRNHATRDHALLHGRVINHHA